MAAIHLYPEEKQYIKYLYTKYKFYFLLFCILICSAAFFQILYFDKKISAEIIIKNILPEKIFCRNWCSKRISKSNYFNYECTDTDFDINKIECDISNDKVIYRIPVDDMYTKYEILNVNKKSNLDLVFSKTDNSDYIQTKNSDGFNLYDERNLDKNLFYSLGIKDNNNFLFKKNLKTNTENTVYNSSLAAIFKYFGWVIILICFASFFGLCSNKNPHLKFLTLSSPFLIGLIYSLLLYFAWIIYFL